MNKYLQWIIAIGVFFLLIWILSPESFKSVKSIKNDSIKQIKQIIDKRKKK